jgi:hypothetical protein
MEISMKKSERKEMKSIKIDGEVHAKLLILGKVFNDSVSGVIDVMIDNLYPDAKSAAESEQEIIERMRRKLGIADE